MGKNVPCYQCDSRTDICHSNCQLYAEWCNNRSEEREKRLNSADYIIRQYESSRSNKLRKIRGYK